MAIKTQKGYKCGYCGKEYTGRNGQQEADECKDKHNLIYVALSKEDLNKLILFIFSKEDRILPPDLVERLQSYIKGSFDFNIPKD